MLAVEGGEQREGVAGIELRVRDDAFVHLHAVLFQKRIQPGLRLELREVEHASSRRQVLAQHILLGRCVRRPGSGDDDQRSVSRHFLLACQVEERGGVALLNQLLAELGEAGAWAFWGGCCLQGPFAMPREEVDLLGAHRAELEEGVGQILLGDGGERGVRLVGALAPGEHHLRLARVELVLRRQLRVPDRISKGVFELSRRLGLIALEELLKGVIGGVAGRQEADGTNRLLEPGQRGARLGGQCEELLLREIPARVRLEGQVVDASQDPQRHRGLGGGGGEEGAGAARGELAELLDVRGEIDAQQRQPHPRFGRREEQRARGDEQGERAGQQEQQPQRTEDLSDVGLVHGSSPALRLHRAVGEQQREEDDGEEEHQGLHVQHAPEQVLELRVEGEVADEGAQGLLHALHQPVQHHPGQQHHEGEQRGHHLALGQRGDEHPHRHAGGSPQEQPAVAQQHRGPLQHGARGARPEGREEQREDEGQPQRGGDDAQASQVLAQHQLEGPHRCRHQQLEGLVALLLGEQPHGEEGRHEEGDDHHRAPELDHHPVREVAVDGGIGREPGPAHLTGLLVHRLEGLEQAHEEQRGDGHHRREDRIGPGGGEVDGQLLAGDRQGGTHAGPLDSRAAPLRRRSA
ncbi:hypothetical protein STIAU_5347 [Stigmatella aurantiaca DW4/3-1]|uniref:Uncharacterized protein n=1 Tax=Stigmatella aurantiaca (strain DW4/3-1) TaxID=378806 RepID=Q08XR9_STIAD|nr:hypothetical protein STIAU_5347 [Stigmatella aurantiaca DW4/3-1]